MALPYANENTTTTTSNPTGEGCPCCSVWQRQLFQLTQEEEEVDPTSKHKPVQHFGDFYVLRNADVYTLENDNVEAQDEAPQKLDVWVGGGKIWALTPHNNSSRILCPSMPGLQEIDLVGMTLCPGFVDIHQHVTGGGGEAGFGSRTPEANTSDLIDAGVTTFVATLGTDTVTRGMENLIAKTRSLAQAGGLTGKIWLGGYSFPIENTVTGSVRRDVTFIPEIMGVGELAISDHRGSYPSTAELTRLVSEVRVAGLLSGKAGVSYFHLGEDESALQPLKRVVEQNPKLGPHIVPTHMERSSVLVQEGIRWMRAGGRIDFSGWPERQRTALAEYVKDPKVANLIRRQLSISSDSYGSINVFDDNGKLVRFRYGLPDTLLRSVFALVYEDKLTMSTVLRFVCRNPASVIRLDDAPAYKGRIHIGGDADLLVLKLPPFPLPDDYPRTRNFDMNWPNTKNAIQYVIAGGRVLKSPASVG